MYIVPLAINYDRLFEIRNLATEIVSGHTGKTSMTKLYQMVRQQGEGSVGKVYMTFGKEINLEDYLALKQFKPLTAANLDAAAFKLTSDLFLEQKHASPVVLNMIVAALLLHHTSLTCPFPIIYDQVKSIYSYLLQRGGVKIIMRETPSKISVLDTIKHLGFTVTENVDSSKPSGKRRY